MIEPLKKPVRVRFAPSPTGSLHLGGARTALFNWLFAKQHNGQFILRIEDTDIERSDIKYEESIIQGLRWLELFWDEGPDIGGNFGPYKQSERLDIYEKYLKKLIDEEKAYYCFCSKEELEADRQAMLSQGLAPKYGGRCRHIGQEETEKRLKKGESAVIRFKTPSIEIEFNDLIRGKITVNAEIIGDLVIAKNLRSPLFIFAGTIDDYEMKITHIIRGEDHLPNTPKQILLQKALGFNEIKYAHLPLILAPDRSKMSKRYMETSLLDFKNQGYLAETIVNFLAFLGWHPKDNKEFFSLNELIQEFDIKRVQKSGAVFNVEKLEWLNAQYIRNIDSVSLAEQLKDFIPTKWRDKKDLLIKALHIEKERIKKLNDFKELADFFFELPDYDANMLKWKEMTNEQIIKNLKLLIDEIDKISETEFNKNTFEADILTLAETIGRGELLWPLRTALSGKSASPGPFDIMEALGKKETLRRINVAIKKLS
ncbi:MAG: glutamate--tRNA ligase [Patescibacteria group bacterium]